jgi:hypothetical protein
MTAMSAMSLIADSLVRIDEILPSSLAVITRENEPAGTGAGAAVLGPVLRLATCVVITHGGNHLQSV